MSLLPPRPHRPRLGRGAAAFVGAVLLGLLGMHALAMSCGTGQGATVPSSVTATSPIDRADQAHTEPAASGSGHTTHHDPGHDGSTSTLAGICVGLVVSTFWLLAAVHRAVTGRGWLVPRLRVVDLHRAQPVQLPPRSPAPHQLCLLRC